MKRVINITAAYKVWLLATALILTLIFLSGTSFGWAELAN